MSPVSWLGSFLARSTSYRSQGLEKIVFYAGNACHPAQPYPDSVFRTRRLKPGVPLIFRETAELLARPEKVPGFRPLGSFNHNSLILPPCPCYFSSLDPPPLSETVLCSLPPVCQRLYVRTHACVPLAGSVRYLCLSFSERCCRALCGHMCTCSGRWEYPGRVASGQLTYSPWICLEEIIPQGTLRPSLSTALPILPGSPV